MTKYCVRIFICLILIVFVSCTSSTPPNEIYEEYNASSYEDEKESLQEEDETSSSEDNEDVSPEEKTAKLIDEKKARLNEREYHYYNLVGQMKSFKEEPNQLIYDIFGERLEGIRSEEKRDGTKNTCDIEYIFVDLNNDGVEEIIINMWSVLYGAYAGIHNFEVWRINIDGQYEMIGEVVYTDKGAWFGGTDYGKCSIMNQIVNSYRTIWVRYRSWEPWGGSKFFSVFYYYDGNKYVSERILLDWEDVVMDMDDFDKLSYNPDVERDAMK